MIPHDIGVGARPDQPERGADSASGHSARRHDTALAGATM
jgi:hypothetical protein